MKVSLIIPVYNVEDYLEKCLTSVEKQTYNQAEVIIVNDGSPDNSYKIIDKFVARNENFISYKIENSGLGGARNFGLTKANGEYIVFLDSDDYISEDCLQKFIDAAEKNDSDIVVCNSCDVDENGTVIRYSKNNVCNLTTSLSEIPEILLNRPCAWAKMYRKSLFEDLSYASREWYEDLRLTPKLFLKAKRITYIEDSLFFYVQRTGSIMNSANAHRNLEILTAFDDLISHFKKNDAYEEFKEELLFLMLDHIAVAGITRVILSGSKEKKQVIKKLQNYISQFEGLYNNRYIPLFSSNKRLIMQLNKNKLYFLTALCMKIKNKLS
ncbi:MAG: glycosyltransferase family 2 protein [Acutalibacteraceae bacterium]|nr:glycosyltransferase family 2 protein [Acutalibacteraceae bacterium]